MLPKESRMTHATAPSIDPSPNDPSTLILKEPAAGACQASGLIPRKIKLLRSFHTCHRRFPTFSREDEFPGGSKPLQSKGKVDECVRPFLPSLDIDHKLDQLQHYSSKGEDYDLT